MEGIEPTLDLGRSDGFGNGSGIWLFAILALMWGGGGFFGNRNQTPTDYARQSDVIYTSAFNQLQDENSQIRSEVQRVGYEGMATTKDTAYNNLAELRDIQSQVANGFANMQTCCCATQKEILTNRYESALNTSAITKAILEDGAKTRELLTQNRMADMQNQINALQLAQATAGVVRYPMASTYTSGTNPFCSCGSSNI